MAADNETKPEGKLKVGALAETEKKPRKFLRILKILALALFVLCLIIGGFFIGVYLRVFDTNIVNEKLELYKYPIIGQYFVEPVQADTNKNEEAVATDPINNEEKKTNGTDTQGKILTETTIQEPSPPVILDKTEIEKQLKLRQAEESKRIGKLARLYGQMKPAEAVAILDQLNDDMVIAILGKMDETQVAKILSAFETSRSARITQTMYNGKPPVISQVR